MVILSKACKPDNFESHNSLKLESNSPDILALFETNLNDSIDSVNFSVRGYLPLIQKDSGTHICLVWQLMLKKDFLLQETYLSKTLQILTYAFDWLYFTQFLTSFFLY